MIRFQIIKLGKRLHITIGIIVFFLCFVKHTQAQKFKTSLYGVTYIANINKYKQSISIDTQKQMAELKKVIPTILYDLRYATAKNFVQQAMYPTGTKHSFLRLPAACALRNVQQELERYGLGLKVFDAYRPYSVTIKFWHLIKDIRYVAHPSKGSGHNRGLAIDLTVVDLKTGIELDMGTPFDHFSDTSHHSFKHLSSTVLQNRILLKEVMIKYGFQFLQTEWWHYYWPNNRNYEVLDIDFVTLANNIN